MSDDWKVEDERDFQLVRSSSFQTRLDACERILARHGITKSLGKASMEVHRAINSLDPEAPRPYEFKNFNKAVVLLRKYVKKHGQVVDYGSLSHEQLNSLLLEVCTSFGSCPNTQFIRLLLELGADHQTTDKFGRSAYFMAISSYRFETLKLFIEHGADINEVYRYPEKDFHAFVWLQCVPWAEPEEIGYMLAQGADVTSRDSDGSNALHGHCGTRAYLEAVRQLVVAGVEIDGVDAYGRSPLSVICREMPAKLGTIAHLLEEGADPNIADESGRTALHHAARVYRAKGELIEILLEAGALINDIDAQGDTPLHLAVARENIDVVGVLTQHHASLSIPNKRGRTPCGVAIEKGFVEIAKLLDDDAENSYRNRPEYAELEEVKAQILYKLRSGIKYYSSDKEGYTHFLFQDGVYVYERYSEGRKPPSTQIYKTDQMALKWLHDRYKYSPWCNDSELSIFKAVLENLRHG